MKDDSRPILTWIALLLIAVVIEVIAVITEVHTATTAGGLATSTSTSIVLAAATSTASSTVAHTVPTAPTASAPMPDYRLCTANDLTGSAGWQGATGALVGALKVTNSSSSFCSLPHDGKLDIFSGTEALPVRQIAASAASGTSDSGAYSDMAPGTQIYVWFSWSNWCGAVSTGYPASLRLTLPESGYLKVPLIGSDGRPQSDRPRCDAPTSPSIVRVWY